ncbi:hypothetical protein C1646_762177 [Rhizophagus diaphanus]|nr:hypothetical protein C1646_762177 [Rhizophagus diaphanus] [Rhizophagus sp. MUCL 43196]
MFLSIKAKSLYNISYTIWKLNHENLRFVPCLLSKAPAKYTNISYKCIYATLRGTLTKNALSPVDAKKKFIFFNFTILPLLFGISEASTSFTSDNPLHQIESKRGILMNKKGREERSLYYNLVTVSQLPSGGFALSMSTIPEITAIATIKAIGETNAEGSTVLDTV